MVIGDSPLGLPITRSRAEYVFPTLTETQVHRVAAHGHVRPISRGEVLIEQGQNPFAFFVVVSGELESVRPSAAETIVAVFGPGHTNPSRRITKGILSPVLFSVDSAGRLYVPNYAPPQQPQLANIVEFAPGGSVPTNTITSMDYVSPFGTALTPSF